MDRGLVKQRRPAHFVQTDRAVHEQWAALTLRSPRAAALMHTICAQMSEGHEAVIASWGTLSALSGMSVSTVRRAAAELVEGSWVQRVAIGKGSACAFVVNSRVAWTAPRDSLAYARFQATVVAASVEQDEATMLEASAPLKKVPLLRTGEMPVPIGEGLPPPSQPQLDGLPPPTIEAP